MLPPRPVRCESQWWGTADASRMAGLDQPNNGDAFLKPGATVGILAQEPTLNESKTVLGNVEEGLGENDHAAL